MKKSAVLLSCVLAASMAVPVMADDAIKVVVNGKNITFEDQAPIIKNDRTLVPLRGVLENMGITVEWNAEDQGVSAVRGADRAYFKIGSSSLSTTDGTVTLDVAPEIINERTMIPLRAVAEAFGADVKWDDATKTITITDSVKITAVDEGTISKEGKADDGTVIYTVDVKYPILNDSCTAAGKTAINEAIKKSVEDAVNAELVNIEKSAKETYASIGEQGREFRPLSVFGVYNVTELTDKTFSFYVDLSSDYLGAHPMTARFGHTYDLASGKELAITDLTGKSAEETTALINAAFTEKIKAAPESFFEDALDKLDEKLQGAAFYVKDGKITLAASLYSIAPYAAGFIEATI